MHAGWRDPGRALYVGFRGRVAEDTHEAQMKRRTDLFALVKSWSWGHANN